MGRLILSEVLTSSIVYSCQWLSIETASDFVFCTLYSSFFIDVDALLLLLCTELLLLSSVLPTLCCFGKL